MKEFKIIFAGSMGAGKTTAIRTLSDVDIASTEVANTDKHSHSKLLTTVGIDYGHIMLPPDIKVGLYGTPGQERFEMIWRVISAGALGAIILIDSSNPKAIEELPYYVTYFSEREIANIIIALSHTDLPDQYLTMNQAIELLHKRDLMLPVYEVDCREKEDILLLIETLISSVEADL